MSTPPPVPLYSDHVPEGCEQSSGEQHEAAIADFKKAISLEPNNVKAHQKLAEALQKIHAEKLAQYERAIIEKLTSGRKPGISGEPH